MASQPFPSRRRLAGASAGGGRRAAWLGIAALALAIAPLLPGFWLAPQAAQAGGVKEKFAAMGMITFSRRVPAPAFTLPTLTGEVFRLQDLRGKIVFLNFWATWCVPCREEMPAMQSLADAFAQRPFAMVAISQDAAGERVVRPFVEELKLRFTILLDMDKAVTQRYSVRALPSTYLIGRDGAVLGIALGPREWNSPQARALIEALLELPAAAPSAAPNSESAN